MPDSSVDQAAPDDRRSQMVSWVARPSVRLRVRRQVPENPVFHIPIGIRVQGHHSGVSSDAGPHSRQVVIAMALWLMHRHGAETLKGSSNNGKQLGLGPECRRRRFSPRAWAFDYSCSLWIVRPNNIRTSGAVGVRVPRGDGSLVAQGFHRAHQGCTSRLRGYCVLDTCSRSESHLRESKSESEGAVLRRGMRVVEELLKGRQPTDSEMESERALGT